MSQKGSAVTDAPYRSVRSAGQANYPVNCWYVVASSDEVGAALLPRQVLDTRLVLFRQTSGAVAALQDRCAHRAAPLSSGALVNDQVVCPYHGFTYAADGACVLVPSQRHVPYGAQVRSFPIHESPPFVWAWLGDPARSAGIEPPDVPELREPGWTTLGGSSQVGANYMLLHDNALDRTHFPFVHPHRIHRGYVEDPPPLQVEVTETTVSYTRTFAPAPLTGWQQEATHLPADGLYTQRESGIFVSPAMHVDQMDILGPGEHDQIFRGAFIRAFTPIDPDHTLVIWRAARNYALDDESVTERLREVYEGTMTEDQPLLETIQAHSGGDIGYGVSATTDAAAIRAYQIVEALLAEERNDRVSRRRRR